MGANAGRCVYESHELMGLGLAFGIFFSLKTNKQTDRQLNEKFNMLDKNILHNQVLKKVQVQE